MLRRLALAVPFAACVALGFGAARLRADDGAKDAPAPAANAKEEKVRELLKLQGGEELARLTMDRMLEQFRGIPTLPAGFVEKFKERVDIHDLMELTVGPYAKHLDDATLDATIAFYRSAEGRKLAAQLPAITMETMDASTAWGRKVGVEVARELAQKPK